MDWSGADGYRSGCAPPSPAAANARPRLSAGGRWGAHVAAARPSRPPSPRGGHPTGLCPVIAKPSAEPAPGRRFRPHWFRRPTRKPPRPRVPCPAGWALARLVCFFMPRLPGARGRRRAGRPGPPASTDQLGLHGRGRPELVPRPAAAAPCAEDGAGVRPRQRAPPCSRKSNHHPAVSLCPRPPRDLAGPGVRPARSVPRQSLPGVCSSSSGSASGPHSERPRRRALPPSPVSGLDAGRRTILVNLTWTRRRSRKGPGSEARIG